MNWGYAEIDPEEEELELDEKDEENRYSIQLYRHVVGSIEIADLEVLEIGSGRGGGAHFVKKYFKPKTLTGVDFLSKAVEMSNEEFSEEGLLFVHGDAEDLPFEDNRFDAVINIESSHCYVKIKKFYAQVHRVLRPHGYFLYADLFEKSRVESIRDDIRNAGLSIAREKNITKHVVRSLDNTSDRKLKKIVKLSKILALPMDSPRINFSKDMCGLRGTEEYNRLVNGEVFYLSFIVVKSRAPSCA